MQQADWKHFDEVLRPKLPNANTTGRHRSRDTNGWTLRQIYTIRLGNSTWGCSTEKETKTQREHDYGEKESVLSITNSYYATSTRDGKLHQKIDIDSWNHVLAQAGRDDYVDWWVDTIERADEIGDTKSIQMFKALAVLFENFCSKQHIKTHAGNTIDSAEDLAQVWHEFLSGKFDAPELEEAQQTFDDLDTPSTTDNDFSLDDFHAAICCLKAGKAAGPDGITAEVWSHSTIAQVEVFFFLREVWQRECVSKTLVLCVFVLIHKQGDVNDCTNYRVICIFTTQPLLQNAKHMPITQTNQRNRNRMVPLRLASGIPLWQRLQRQHTPTARNLRPLRQRKHRLLSHVYWFCRSIR